MRESLAGQKRLRIEQLTTGVTHSTRRFGNPDDLAIAAIDLRLKPCHDRPKDAGDLHAQPPAEVSSVALPALILFSTITGLPLYSQGQYFYKFVRFQL